jgi:DNA-binding transcriptional ArsR family regulator
MGGQPVINASEATTSGRRSASAQYRGQRGKAIEERVSYAISHRTRVYILMLLNEATYDVDQIAEVVGESRDNVRYHIKELLDAGAIELAKVERVRNSKKFFYRTVEMPNYSEEELAEMAPQERQEIIGSTIQNMVAEMLSSFWARRMERYSKLWLGWRWFNLDAQGREDLAQEQERFWARVGDIEAEATNRRAQSGEEPCSMIVGLMGFPRERAAIQAPLAPSNFSTR